MGMPAAEKTCKRGHALTPENVYVSPRGRSSCRVCDRERRQSDGSGVVKRTAIIRRQPTDPALIATFRAACAAGTLDALLMARLRAR